MKTIILSILVLSISSQLNAKKLSEEITELGGNSKLLELSTDLSPDKKMRVVQKRLVPRESRFELGVRYGQKLGGDSYLQTRAYHLNGEYHINPRVSLGVVYSDYGNQLTPEGDRAFKEARSSFSAGGTSTSYPNIDTPLNSIVAQVQIYPIYGKLNFFDYSIIQFDTSIILGYGQIRLDSGNTSLLSTGLGGGFWITNNISARLEIRYEAYQDRDVIYDKSRSLNTVSGQIGLGVLL